MAEKWGNEIQLARGKAIRAADEILLEALRAAGWTSADRNDRDRVIQFLTDHGVDVVVQDVIDWTLLEPVIEPLPPKED